RLVEGDAARNLRLKKQFIHRHAQNRTVNDRQPGKGPALFEMLSDHRSDDLPLLPHTAHLAPKKGAIQLRELLRQTLNPNPFLSLPPHLGLIQGLKRFFPGHSSTHVLTTSKKNPGRGTGSYFRIHLSESMADTTFSIPSRRSNRQPHR